MPSYALLGGTGSTGSAIIRCLLLRPPEDLTFNIFVRSGSKLYKAFPDLESITAFRVNIIQGVPSDVTAMQECLKDVDVVMACIGTNYCSPSMTIVYDTAKAIVDALKAHRKTQGPSYKTPAILQLRSSSLNPIFKAHLPWIAREAASFCFYHNYADLTRACDLFASCMTEFPGLLKLIIVDPPSIHDHDGTAPTGYKLIIDEVQHPELSYADLGAAFCELTERRVEFVGKAVGVTAAGKVNATCGTSVGYMAVGAKSRIWG